MTDEIASDRLAPHYEGLQKALERIAALTPERANAATAHDLYCTVNAIAETALASQSPPPTDDVQGEIRSLEILRRALAWHGDWTRMATTREDWQQEVDEALRWVIDNPEDNRPPRPAFSAQLPPPIRGEGLGALQATTISQMTAQAISEVYGDSYEEVIAGLSAGMGEIPDWQEAIFKAVELAVDAILPALATPSSPKRWVLVPRAVLERVRALLVGQMQAAGGHSLPEAYYEKHPEVQTLDAMLAASPSSKENKS